MNLPEYDGQEHSVLRTCHFQNDLTDEREGRWNNNDIIARTLYAENVLVAMLLPCTAESVKRKTSLEKSQQRWNNTEIFNTGKNVSMVL